MWCVLWLLGCGASTVEGPPEPVGVAEEAEGGLPLNEERATERVRAPSRGVPPPPPEDAEVPVLALDADHAFRGRDGTAYVIDASNEVHLDTSWTPTGPDGIRPNAVHILLGFGKFFRVGWPESGPIVIGPQTVAALEGSMDEWLGFRAGTIVMLAAVVESEPGQARGAVPVWATTVNVRGLDGSVPAMKSPLSTTGASSPAGGLDDGQ